MEQRTSKLKIALTPFTKTNSKLILDLNAKHKTIKLREDNRRKFNDLGRGSDFFYNTRSATREKHKLDFIKFKNFCSAKDIIKRNRRQSDWEKIFAKDISDK